MIYWQDNLRTLYNKDCRKMSDLPDESNQNWLCRAAIIQLFYQIKQDFFRLDYDRVNDTAGHNYSNTPPISHNKSANLFAGSLFKNTQVKETLSLLPFYFDIGKQGILT